MIGKRRKAGTAGTAAIRRGGHPERRLSGESARGSLLKKGQPLAAVLDCRSFGRPTFWIAAALALFALTSMAHAADRYWIATGGATNWNTTANWSTTSGVGSGASVPGAGDQAIFDAGGNAGCNIDITVSVSSMTLNSGYAGTVNTQSNAVTISENFKLSAGAFTAGGSTITVNGTVDRRGGSFSAGASVFKLAGSAAQSVYSSSGAYWRLQVDNASVGGVDFKDGLTASTFSATAASTYLQFAPSPSSMTVTGYLELNGQATGTRILLKSSQPGSAWKLRLRVGSTHSLHNIKVQDSDASSGLTADASDNTSNDLGNNTNWLLGVQDRYWVAPANGFWSDTANWSLTSGGAGGASVPDLGNNVTFDSASVKNCTLDGSVTASSIALSTSTVGSYVGTFDTQDNLITLSQNLVLNNGTVLARNSIISIGGTLTFSSGTYNANTSSMSVTGNTSMTNGTFNLNGSTMTLLGDLTMASPVVFNRGTGLLNLAGSGKTMNVPFPVGNVTISGTITGAGSNNTNINGVLNVIGTLTLSSNWNLSNGSTATISGVVDGSGNLTFFFAAVLGTGGTLNAPVTYFSAAAVTSRVYNGAVSIGTNSGGPVSTVMGPGSANFAGGLILNPLATGNLTLDASVNNPTVTVTTITYLQQGTGLPILNAGAGTWNVSGLLNMSTGTFNANSAQITFSSSLTQSSGTFNANTSSITVNGDVTLSTGTFNAGSSTITIGGNLSLVRPLVFNGGASTINMTGTGKSLSSSPQSANFSLPNVGILGTIALDGPSHWYTQAGSTLTISGTLTLAMGFSATLNPGAASIVALTGSLLEGNGLNDVLVNPCFIGSAGTLNVPVNFSNADCPVIPSRTYLSGVILSNATGSNYSPVLGPGSVNFAGGLSINTSGAGNQTLDASASNPAVTVTTITFSPSATGGLPIINAGAGTWNVSGPLSLSTGTFNANSATMVFQSSVTISTGAIFNANTAQITFATSVLQSTGTFNANTSSVTINGDTTLSGGTFNAGSSTITAAGNWTMNNPVIFNSGSGILNFTGTNKTLNDGPSSNLNNVNILGSITASGGPPNTTGLLNVSGTLTLNASWNLAAPSTVTISGSINGSSNLVLNGGVVLGAGGILNAPVMFRYSNDVPARVYGGPVTLVDGYPLYTHVAGPGTHTYNGGLTLGINVNIMFDASINNPAIVATTVSVPSAAVGSALKMGSGLWQVANDWNMAVATVTQTTGGILRLNGTVQQRVYSSSTSYTTIDITNTSAGGVRFQDSLTVSSFTALTAGTTIQFAVSPSSLTVTGYLGFGPASGTKVGLRSAVNNSQWGLKLGGSALTSIKNTDVKDSDASGGVFVAANDGSSVDSTNNTNWIFTPITRYWIKTGGAGNWSDPNNWSLTSGGAGGAGIPQATDAVTFDGNGTANCTIDTAVTVSTLTVSTTTSGSYTGIVNTQNYPLSLSQNFTLYNGTFTAGGSTITVSGRYYQAGGVFNANSSTITVAGAYWRFGGATNVGTSAVSLTGSNADLQGGLFFNLNVPGQATIASIPVTISGGTLSIPGTLTVAGQALTLNSGSALTLGNTGSLLGGPYSSGANNQVSIGSNVTINTLGTIMAHLVVNGALTLPARSYGIAVVVNAPVTLAAGTANFNGGLVLGSASGVVDASINNPTVTVSTIIFASGNASSAVNAGTGTWTVTAPITLTTGTFNANSANIVFQSSVTLSAGVVFNASTAQISFSTSVLQSSGTFNANTSSITIVGDVNLNGGTFNAGASTITAAGNWTMLSSVIFNASGGTLNLTGSGKVIDDGPGASFWNINVLGSNSAARSLGISGTLNVLGTLTLNNGCNMQTGSTVTISGTINGSAGFTFNDNVTLGTGGTLNAPITFRYNEFIPGRTYGGAVTIMDIPPTYVHTAGPGTHVYNGGLNFGAGAAVLYDASLYNPSIIVTTVTVNYVGSTIKMGSGTWTVANDWNVAGASITQSAGGILRFNGTGQQRVFSSTNSYGTLDITNTSSAGVQFQDSLTASTFTALTAGTTVQFAVSPSSLTVTNYLGVGVISGAKVGLRSAINGSQWKLGLLAGGTSYIVNTDVKDSDASGGQVIYATSNTVIDSGNNNYWVFVATQGVTRYWVAQTASNWNNPANWSLVSGNNGGAGVPQAVDAVIFDGYGLGNCTIDTSINVSTLTISTSTTGGYMGTINTSSNTINVANSFTMNAGTFNANSSSVTLGGNFVQNNGVFNAAGSSWTVSGNLSQNSGTFNYGTSAFTAIGTGKSLGGAPNRAQYYNLNVGGSGITLGWNNWIDIRRDLNILSSANASQVNLYGTSLTIANGVTLSGGSVDLWANIAISTTGILTAPLLVYSQQTLPERTYGGNIYLNAGAGGGNITLGAGSFNFNGGLNLNVGNLSAGGLFDASISNPTVSVTTITIAGLVGSNSPILKAGSGSWTVSGPILVSTGAFLAQTSTISMSGATAMLTLTSGTFDAGSANISISSSIVMSSGSFNAGTSSITVNGDVTLNGGSFNAGSSTITISGNATFVAAGANFATNTLVLNGVGKFLTSVGRNFFWNLNIPGSITINGSASDLQTVANITGILNLSQDFKLDAGSLFNLSGTLNGPYSLSLSYSGSTLSSGGTLNASVVVHDSNNILPARTYNGAVSIEMTAGAGTVTTTLAAGTHTFNGGLTIGPIFGSSVLILDANANNPTVNIVGNVTRGSFTGTGQIKLGSGVWGIDGNWDMRGIGGSSPILVSQSAGGILRFNGTSIQNVYASSNSYAQIDVVNASANGVRFQDSFTVSTFTALGAGTTIQFPVSPSSVTVTNYLGLGAASGSKVGLRSAVNGSQWKLGLLVGGTSYIVNTDLKDSDASGGQVIYATSNTVVDSGNNNYWVFTTTTSLTRYWVTGSSTNWSNPAAWSLTSGGVAGAGAPSMTDAVIFDGNGLGTCNIDTSVSLSTFTISSITAGGYTGIINTSSNAISVANGFIMSTGTFNAMGSTITINGDVTFNAGVFSAGGSSITAYGNWTMNTSHVWSAGSGILNLAGSSKALSINNTANTKIFNNLTISGSITIPTRSSFNGVGTLTISGTFTNDTINNVAFGMLNGSTVTITGTCNGAYGIELDDAVTLQGGGALNCAITFAPSTQNATVPAKTYNGPVKILVPGASRTATLASGNIVFAGGLTLNPQSSGNLTVDASVNNPTVTVTTITYLQQGSGLPILNAGTGTWIVSAPFTLSSGTFNANSSTAVFQSSVTLGWGGVFNANSSSTTIMGSFTQSTGTFNGGSASLTMMGDILLTGPTSSFRASGSTMTCAGSITDTAGAQAFLAGTSTLIMNGTGKTIGIVPPVYNLVISGNLSTSYHISPSSVNIPGTLNLANSWNLTMLSGSTVTVVGTVNGPGSLDINGSAVLSAGGTLNSPVTFERWGPPALIPARTYNGAVRISAVTGGSSIMLPGAHTYNGGLSISGIGGVTGLDAATNNPTVTISNGFSCSNAANQSLDMGSGLWTISSGNWNLGNCALTQATGGLLRFSGTGLQDVFPSSATYFAIDDVNVSTSGVRFRQSLTVSTFTAISAGTTIQFAVSPSSLTVTNYLGFGPSSGSPLMLRSMVPATRWGLRLAGGATWTVQRTDVQDSDASGGQVINANDGVSIDSGNNLNWTFVTINNRYWVASSSGNWSNGNNWAFASGTGGGAGAPTAGQNAIFDANGNGKCLIDQSVTVANLTISTATPGNYYTEVVDTQGNLINVTGNFTLIYGTFTVRNSTVTLGSLTMVGGGVFNASSATVQVAGATTISPSYGASNFFAGRSSITFNGDFTLDNTALFSAGQSTITAYGNWTMGAFANWSAGSSTLNLMGSGKTFAPGNTPTFWNLNVSGSVTETARFNVNAALNVPGTLTVANSVWFDMNSGSTLTIAGTVNAIGDGSFNINDTAVLGTGGTLSSAVWFQATSANVFAPARTYNGPVYLYGASSTNRSVILGSGSLTFAGGITINPHSSGYMTLDASTYNPNITVTTITYLQQGAGLPILNAGTGTWTVSGLLALSTGTFNANSATIIFSSSIIQSTGTFNAGTSSITVNGDVTLNGGTFNASGSTVTVGGNLILGTLSTFNYGSNTLNLIGIGKLFNVTTGSNGNFWNMNIPGSISVGGIGPSVYGTASISGTLAILSGFDVMAGGSLNLTGTLNGPALFAPHAGSTLSTGGTLNAPVTFWTGTGAATVPARVYNGPVALHANVSGIAAAGTHTYNGGLTLNSGSTYDASTNNPAIIVTTFTAVPTSFLNMGNGAWQVANNWVVTGAAVAQASGGILQLNGTGPQDVASSSATYSKIDIQNTSTGGVSFRDSLTVATFTATAQGTNLSFKINPSSLTVTRSFQLGPASGTKATVRSLTSGTRWGLKLANGTTFYVANVDAQDSDASGGLTIFTDASSVDSGNNVNWQFNPVTTVGADLAPASAPQASEVAVASFTLTAGAAATLQTVRVDRLGSSRDLDVKFIRIYRESGATPGFQNAQDSLVVLTDNNQFTSSSVVVNITNAPAQTINTTPVTYYIVYYLNPNYIGSTTETIGARISSYTYLSFSGGAARPPDFPITTSLTSIVKLGDTMTVTMADLVPVSLPQGQNNIGFAKLTLSATTDRVFWNGLRVERLGSGLDNDITGITLWKDANGNGAFDPGADTAISSGNDAFSAGLTTINFSTQTIDAVTPGLYFLSGNINASASIGNTAGFRLSAATSFLLLSPDVAAAGGYPKNTSIGTVNPAFNTLTISTGNFTAAATLQQGSTNAMMLLTFTSDTGNAIWDGLTLGQIGTAVQSDVNSVLVYRDNGDTLFQPAVDPLVSVSTMTFDASGQVVLTLTSAETISAGTPRSYWVVVKLDPSANIGSSVQIRVTNTGAIRVLTNYTTVAGNFALISAESTITPTIDTLQVTPVDLTPPTVLQAAADVGVLKLSLVADGNTVGLFSIKLDRTGTGADSDLSAIRIYKDNGNGTFGGPGEETLVTAGNDALGNGSSNVFFNATQFVNQSTSVYFVAMDISGAAQVGRTIGLQIATTQYVTVTTPDKVAVTGFPMPNPSAPTTITKQVATVQVSTANLAPSGVDPGTNNQAVMKLTLLTNRNIAFWTSLRVDRVGANNADVPSARVYYDSNNNGTFEAGIDQAISNVTTFDGSNQAVMPLSVTQTLTTTAKRYFVVVNVSNNAVPGDIFRLRWVNNSYLTVTAPDLVSAAAFPFDSAQTTINEPPSTLTIVPLDDAPTTVTQDTLDVVMASFTVVSDRYTASWTRLRVDRIGTGADGDVLAVKLYLDTGNNILGPEDTLLTSGNDTFQVGSANLTLSTQTITTTPKKYFLVFDISAGASANKTLGASVASSGFFNILSPDIMGTTNLPFTTKLMTITATVDTLTVTPTNLAPNLTQGDTNKAVGRMTLAADNHAVVWTALRVDRSGGVDSDISAIALYLDDGDAIFNAAQDTLITSGSNFFTSGSSVLNLISAQTLAAAAKTYFMVVSVSSTATVGATLQLSIASTTYVSVNSPDLVSAANVPATFTSGGAINDLPDTLTVALSTAATTEVYQGTPKYAFAKVTLQTNQDQATLSQLRVAQYGTGADADLSSVMLYADTDGSGDFSGASDTLAAPATTLIGSLVTFVPTTALTATTSPKTYFIVGNISANAVVGNTLGFRIASTLGTIVSNPDVVSIANFPTQGPLGTVLDPHVPRTPLITINSRYSSSPTRLSASWTSSVPLGSITDYQYAIGTTAGGLDVSTWTSVGSQTSVTRTGLLLENGVSYYFSVKAKSDADEWSTTAVSLGVLVDYLVPTPPSTVTSYIDGNSVVLTWSGSGAGPSGISRYYTYMRPGSSPQAVLVGTTSVASSAVFALENPGSSAVPQFTYQTLDTTRPTWGGERAVAAIAHTASGNGVVINNLTPGTYYFSVQSVSNSGLVSERSAESQVLFGVAGLSDVLSAVTNYPNPFDSRKTHTTINYLLNQDSKVTLTLYDIYGSKVKAMTYAAGQTGGLQGSNDATWDGTDDSGNKVSKGIYLCIVQADAVGGNNKTTIKVGVIH